MLIDVARIATHLGAKSWKRRMKIYPNLAFLS